ncbi:type III pantothenate kinase [Alicyclobacillus contaminans]|uniref:type III pantothenate kinase n=1 Tax=Alicyclobacillus contaminans TaxID=392016 RepID=UPI000412FD7F|nr:type III pantothenate kinase [Alicyclobacillus contaminans]GMA50506.1 type III pantothenate kinase [Alicyclobacillus contaminans]
MNRILVVDVGNTNTSIGLFEGTNLVYDWRVSTLKDRTSDEMGLLLKMLFADKGMRGNPVDGIVLASVVPPVVSMFAEMCRRYFHRHPLVVGPGIKTGILVKYENPRDVGADRIANAVGAVQRYGGPVIVVDARTATTFTVVNEAGHYVGGVIAPGVQSAADALFQHTAKLPSIALTTPESVIGRNPVSSMQAGIIFGFADLVDGIVRRIHEETHIKHRVVGTGPYIDLLRAHSRTLEDVDPHLSLHGLRILWDLNH